MPTRALLAALVALIGCPKLSPYEGMSRDDVPSEDDGPAPDGFCFAVDRPVADGCGALRSGLLVGEERDFEVRLIDQGGSGWVTLEVSASGGGPLPSGLLATYPPQLRIGTSGTLTLNAAPSIVPGTYELEVSGRDTRQKFVLVVYGRNAVGAEQQPYEALAISEDGGLAVVGDCTYPGPLGRLMKIDASAFVVEQTLLAGPGASGFQRIGFCPSSLAVTSDHSVLIGGEDALLRLTTTGEVELVASVAGLVSSIALESSGTTALIAIVDMYGISDTGSVSRVDLATGAVTVVSSILDIADFVIEPGGASIVAVRMVGGDKQLMRINLSSGAQTNLRVLANQEDRGAPELTLSADGSSLVTASLTVMNLADNGLSYLAGGGFGGNSHPGAAIDTLPDGSFLSLRVDRATGEVYGALEHVVQTPAPTLVADLGTAEYGVLVTSATTAYYVTTTQVIEVQLSSGDTTPRAASLANFTRLAMAPSGAAYAVHDSGGLYSVDLVAGTSTLLNTTSPFSCPTDLVMIDDSTAFMVENGMDRILMFTDLPTLSFSPLAFDYAPGTPGSCNAAHVTSISLVGSSDLWVGGFGPLVRLDTSAAATELSPGPVGPRLARLTDTALVVGSVDGLAHLDLVTGKRVRYAGARDVVQLEVESPTSVLMVVHDGTNAVLERMTVP